MFLTTYSDKPNFYLNIAGLNYKGKVEGKLFVIFTFCRLIKELFQHAMTQEGKSVSLLSRITMLTISAYSKIRLSI